MATTSKLPTDKNVGSKDKLSFIERIRGPSSKNEKMVEVKKDTQVQLPKRSRRRAPNRGNIKHSKSYDSASWTHSTDTDEIIPQLDIPEPCISPQTKAEHTTKPRIMSSARKLFRKSFIHKDKELTPRGRSGSILSPQESQLISCYSTLNANELSTTMNDANIIIMQFRAIEQEVDSKMSVENHLSFASAYYCRAHCHYKEKEYISAESSIRECLSLLDDHLLENQTDLSNSSAVLQSTDKYWLPPFDTSMESNWMRKSNAEELLGIILFHQKASVISAEWLQRSIYSSERAGIPAKPPIVRKLANMVVEFISLNIERAKLLLHVSRWRVVQLLTLLDYVPKLEHLGSQIEFSYNMGSSSLTLKESLDTNNILLQVWQALLDVHTLELDSSMKDEQAVWSYNKDVLNKIDKVQKEIKKIQKKMTVAASRIASDEDATPVPRTKRERIAKTISNPHIGVFAF